MAAAAAAAAAGTAAAKRRGHRRSATAKATQLQRCPRTWELLKRAESSSGGLATAGLEAAAGAARPLTSDRSSSGSNGPIETAKGSQGAHKRGRGFGPAQQRGLRSGFSPALRTNVDPWCLADRSQLCRLLLGLLRRLRRYRRRARPQLLVYICKATTTLLCAFTCIGKCTWIRTFCRTNCIENCHGLAGRSAAQTHWLASTAG